MSLAYVPIYTQTVGSSATYSINFNNIPTYFDDLLLKVSPRDTNSAIATNLFFRLNNDSSSLYSQTRLSGNGSSASSDRTTGDTTWKVDVNAGTSTTNTFSSIDLYLPNYRSSNFKTGVLDSVSENNATTAYTQLVATLFRSTNAITSVNLICGIQFVQYMTVSLYGIIRPA